MKAKELRSLSEKNLQGKLHELRKELIKENTQIATGTTPKSPGKVKNTKKTIARIYTIMNEKEAKK